MSDDRAHEQVELALIVEGDPAVPAHEREAFSAQVLADLRVIYGAAVSPAVVDVTCADVLCLMSLPLTRREADDLAAAELLGKNLRAAAARLGPCSVAVVLDGVCHVLRPAPVNHSAVRPVASSSGDE